MDDYNQTTNEGFVSLWPFAASAAIGLVLGLERRQAAAPIGLKLYILIALFGALAGLVAEASGSAVMLAAGLIAAGAAAGATAWMESSDSRERGTTLLVALWCFSLGAATWYGYTQAALMLSVISVVLLRSSAPQRGVMLRWAPGDATTTVLFVVVMLAALPLTADQEYGPYGAVNPYHTWLVVALFVAISWTGYAAWRLRGHWPGSFGTGVVGGAISATVTTAGCARAAAHDPSSGPAGAMTVGIASLVALVRVTLVAAATMPKFLPALALIPLAAIVCSLPVAVIQARRRGGWVATAAAAEKSTGYRNPAGLARVLLFTVAYLLALIVTAWFSDISGRPGFFAVSLVAGIATGEPVALAALRLGTIGDVGERDAVAAFACALAAMVVAKLMIAQRLGGRAFGRQCLPVLGLCVLGICVGAAVALALLTSDR